jgi:hypothetical protein
VRFRFDEIADHRDRYGDDYLRVTVDLDAPVSQLYERVREVLPHALDVTAVRSDATEEAEAHGDRRGLAPHELFARYYNAKHKAEPPPPIMAAFNELYEEARGASS